MSIGMVGVFVGLMTAGAVEGEGETEFRGYRTELIEGWKVQISEEVYEKGEEKGAQLIGVLQEKLGEVSKVLPEQRVKALRSVLIWVEFDDQASSPIVYHRSDRWLRRSGKNPAKAGGIEICNVKQALYRINRQPMVILHELSHAYHHRELGLEEKIIREAYAGAMAAGLYAKVKKGNGDELVAAYASRNAEEYFAELSEAYFGKNDYYPFNREELKKYDPDGYLMVSRLWLLR
ncbi:MAG: hypothetical protein P8J87_15275 [Verrucomicrobiales bacterium]|nr:hypothetical protein [Verrucomicrobiales bacterium]